MGFPGGDGLVIISFSKIIFSSHKKTCVMEVMSILLLSGAEALAAIDENSSDPHTHAYLLPELSRYTHHLITV